MQIDSVRIWRPPWDNYEPTAVDFSLFHEPWTYIAAGGGPVRCWATMASPQFRLDFRPLTAGARTAYNCQLIRTISLYADADYVIEDLRVRGTPVDSTAGEPGDLAFAAHYYMSANLSLLPQVVHYAHIPDWFGIGVDASWTMPRMPGYGFATDAHVTVVRNPPPGFPRPENEEHKAFGWSTDAAPRIKALHLFQFDTSPAKVADDIGKLWYAHLLEPLRGAPAKEQE
jgi:hypothetical protein